MQRRALLYTSFPSSAQVTKFIVGKLSVAVPVPRGQTGRQYQTRVSHQLYISPNNSALSISCSVLNSTTKTHALRSGKYQGGGIPPLTTEKQTWVCNLCIYSIGVTSVGSHIILAGCTRNCNSLFTRKHIRVCKSSYHYQELAVCPEGASNWAGSESSKTHLGV